MSLPTNPLEPMACPKPLSPQVFLFLTVSIISFHFQTRNWYWLVFFRRKLVIIEMLLVVNFRVCGRSSYFCPHKFARRQQHWLCVCVYFSVWIVVYFPRVFFPNSLSTLSASFQPIHSVLARALTHTIIPINSCMQNEQRQGGRLAITKV